MKFPAIRENHLYAKAYSKGNRFVGKLVAVYILPDYAAKRLQKQHPQKIKVNRIGLTVTKKLGGAVVRNRTKRIIREAYRKMMQESSLKVGFLVVIAAREAAVGKKTDDIYRELKYAFQKLGMFGA